MEDALKRLDKNLQELRDETKNNPNFRPETAQQRIAQDMIVNVATAAAATRIPEGPAVETFTRAYRSGVEYSSTTGGERWGGGERSGGPSGSERSHR